MNFRYYIFEMKSLRNLSAGLVISALLLASPVVVLAEGPGSDPTFTQDQVTTQQQQQTQQTTEQQTVKTEVVSEDNTKSFLTGAGAGAVVGLIVGGVFAWLFKDKILSNK